MGTKFMIVFDLKINDKITENQLRNIINDNFERFVAGIRRCNELDIRIEEKKY